MRSPMCSRCLVPDSFGIVFLEAAASGLHVIGGDQDGTPDALAVGYLGIMINPHDQIELKKAVVQAFGTLRRTGIEKVQRYGMDNYSDFTNSLIKNFSAAIKFKH